MKRFFVSFLFLILISSLLLMSVFAAEDNKDYTVIDYNDYYYDLELSGDYVTVYCSFPTDNFLTLQYMSGNYGDPVYGSTFTFDYLKGTYGSFQFQPFGKSFFDIREIPSGSNLWTSLSLKITSQTPDTYLPTIWYVDTHIAYYDVNMKYMDTVTFTTQHDFRIADFDIGVPVNKVDYKGASYILLHYGIRSAGSGKGDFTVTGNYKSFYMDFSVEALLREQQISGKTNQLFESVQDKLEEALHGSVTPEAPENSDKVEDLDKSESDLRDKLESYFGTFTFLFANAMSGISNYLSEFMAFIWIFDLFADLTFISRLLYISLALGIFASLVNIVMNVSRSGYDGSGKSSGKSSGKRSGKEGG